jgi:hypothetical protein
MPSWTGEINTEKSDVNYSKGGWSPMPPRGLRLPLSRSGAAVDGYQDPRINGAAKKEVRHLRRCEPHFAIEPRWRPTDGKRCQRLRPPKTAFFAICLQRLIGRLCASQVLVSVGPHHGHSNRPGAFTPRVWNSPDCADARWRQLRLKYVHKPTFWAAAKTLARPDQNLCSPCSDTSCVGILHFGRFGSALGTLFDSPTEALLARASLRATKPC